jgi:hypothetical protein
MRVVEAASEIGLERDRSGEGTFLMTEQFAFQEIQRDSRAIQFYKGTSIALT